MQVIIIIITLHTIERLSLTVYNIIVLPHIQICASLEVRSIKNGTSMLTYVLSTHVT